MKIAKIGLIGLAVMGANLARNLASKNIPVLVFNRTAAKTDEFMKNFGSDPCLQVAYSLEEMVQKLERPRKIILMIQAGAPVDAMLDTLTPLLEKGDIVIDGGNSYFEDTRRRSAKLAELGMEFVGMGVSGGEEGALHGPSLMLGCSEKAYVQLEPMLQAISAKAGESGKEPCVTYIGTDGAGHYVKMVHNGIEYADMQLIADVYTIMRQVLGMEPEEMAKVWDEWNKGELSSYLVEITANILKKKDAETGKAMVDVILDVAKQKGTGRWTSMSALELGVATPTITEAVFARNMSGYKEERKELEKVYCRGRRLPLWQVRKWLQRAIRQLLRRRIKKLPLRKRKKRSCWKICAIPYMRPRSAPTPRASTCWGPPARPTAGTCRWIRFPKSGGTVASSGPGSWMTSAKALRNRPV